MLACPGATASENSQTPKSQVWAREYWSDGIKRFWEIGNWDIEKFLFTAKSIKEHFSLKNQYSNIPASHYPMY